MEKIPNRSLIHSPMKYLILWAHPNLLHPETVYWRALNVADDAAAPLLG